MFNLSILKQPLISIIIPVYNVEPYIADCLQSVMNQTYQGPMECIVVDDYGTDNSMAVAEKLISEYEGPIAFKVFHHEHNKGLSMARNTGMDVAEGEYFFFLDSDDWVSDDCIERLVEPLRQEEFDVIVGDYVPMERKMLYPLKLILPEGAYVETGISDTFFNKMYVMAWNKLYRKEFILKNQLSFEEGRFHEDEILAFELSCIEKTFYVVKQVTYYYRRREDSIAYEKDCYKKIMRYIGVLQSIKEKVKRYSNVEGIYDFYMFWIKRVFSWISRINLDGGLLSFVQVHTKGFLSCIPCVCYLRNKHNRLVYYACKKEQTYLRYEYVTKDYAEQLRGRVMRKVLDLLPYKNQARR